MARVAWTDESQSWLRDIFDYIAADNPEAAARTVQGIFDRAQALADFPEMGARYRASDRHVRVLLYGHYRIAYLVREPQFVGRSSISSGTRFGHGGYWRGA
jgi:toxin ParE1/3/4